MARCITCGSELHPDRARKYNYCMAPDCQAKNVRGLSMVAIGMDQAAEEFLILDDQAREDLASGKYRDQRRGTFGPTGPPARTPGRPGTDPATASPAHTSPAGRAAERQAQQAGPNPKAARSRAGGPQHHGPQHHSACPGRRRRSGWLCSTTSRACGRTRSRPSSGCAATWRPRSCWQPGNEAGRDQLP